MLPGCKDRKHSFLCRASALVPEKVLQQGGAVIPQDAGKDRRAVSIALGEQVDDAAAGAGERLPRAEDHDRDTGVDHGSGREGIFPYPLATISFERFWTRSCAVREALVGVKLADEIGSGGKVASQSSTGQ